ncbi:MAG: hypothetical protein K9W46_00075 [Candidatus Heimdallarchaeum endolithica]|uniref:Uncharacterized protein n=1 Tax=Candidatus Heimdallarchaeum endolithica TaxID=2876572 RepID=A0A9Y1BQZ9_9ARCH|nr:MAG: hypothetical protein K9W46_00075 [Candidatus Heimdallarchaeum endolithica]
MEIKHYLSKNFTNKDFPSEYSKWSLDDKIKLFIDRVKYWQLDIANKVINGFETTKGLKFTGIPDSGFATLNILFVYFETIGKYGYRPLGKPKEKFIAGFKAVHNDLKWNYATSENELVTIAKKVYEKVRCGVYHVGMTEQDISLTSETKNPFEIIWSKDKIKYIIINPHELARDLLKHCDIYEKRLRDSSEEKLRKNFEKGFDLDNEPKMDT